MEFPVELKLRGSKVIRASVWVVHVAVALALFHVPALLSASGRAVDWALACGAWTLLGASLVRGLRAQASLEACSLWLERDGLLELVRESDGAGGLFRVRVGSQVVLPNAAWFALVPVAVSASAVAGSGARRFMLVPDNLSAGSFRLLRIWLRHCSAHVSQGEGARP